MNIIVSILFAFLLLTAVFYWVALRDLQDLERKLQIIRRQNDMMRRDCDVLRCRIAQLEKETDDWAEIVG